MLNEKKSNSKKKIILLVSILFLITLMPVAHAGLFDWLCNWFGWFCDDVQGEGMDLSLQGDALVFTKGDKAVILNISAIINGSEYSVANNIVYFKEPISNGFKWGANITIPNQFTADNLEEIVFSLKSNIELKRLRNIVREGYCYYDETIEGEFSNTYRYACFDFYDIVELYRNNNVTLIKEIGYFLMGNQTIYTARLRFNVTEINFVNGQVIELDPQITIQDVSITSAILNNITAENNFTHLTIGDENTGFINETNLVLYMPFDTNTSSTNAYDYTANDNDGTIHGNVFFNSDGIIGAAYNFSANNESIEVADDQSLNFSVNEGFTVSLWVKGNEAQNTATFNPLISKRDGNSRGWVIWYIGDGNDLYRFNIRQVGQSPSNLNVNFNTQWLDGNWHHIVAGRNTTALFGYVDGDFDALLADTDMIDVSNSFPLCIGQDTMVGSCEAESNFTGMLDEVMIMNVSLNADQIKSLFNNQSSRFFHRGEQIFNNISIDGSGANNRLNITINSSTNFDSVINVSIGDEALGDYSYGSELAFINNRVTDAVVGSSDNFSLKFIFYAGNMSINSFISPTLENDIVIDSWTEDGVDTCTYTAGDWDVACSDNCSIVDDVDVGGNDISITGTGVFNVIGANITGFANFFVAGTSVTNRCIVYILSGGSIS